MSANRGKAGIPTRLRAAWPWQDISQAARTLAVQTSLDAASFRQHDYEAFWHSDYTIPCRLTGIFLD